MKALLIDPETRSVIPQQYDGRPDSLYTLFRSLLVDSSDVLNNHVIYSGAEAFEKEEKGFFLGEKLLFGRTLIVGHTGLEEDDATIPADEAEALVRFEIPSFYRDALALLPRDFSFDEPFELRLEEGGEHVTVEWVLYAFNLADEATKSYFLEHLSHTLSEGGDVYDYLKKMGNLALKAMRG